MLLTYFRFKLILERILSFSWKIGPETGLLLIAFRASLILTIKNICFISDRIRSNRNFTWVWKKTPSNPMESMKLNALSGATFAGDFSSWSG